MFSVAAVFGRLIASVAVALLAITGRNRRTVAKGTSEAIKSIRAAVAVGGDSSVSVAPLSIAGLSVAVGIMSIAGLSVAICPLSLVKSNLSIALVSGIDTAGDSGIDELNLRASSGHNWHDSCSVALSIATTTQSINGAVDVLDSGRIAEGVSSVARGSIQPSGVAVEAKAVGLAVAAVGPVGGRYTIGRRTTVGLSEATVGTVRCRNPVAAGRRSVGTVGGSDRTLSSLALDAADDVRSAALHRGKDGLRVSALISLDATPIVVFALVAIGAGRDGQD